MTAASSPDKRAVCLTGLETFCPDTQGPCGQEAARGPAPILLCGEQAH